MYKFIDTMETAEEWLPSEAVSINGEYIENSVKGYRTLYVKGREAFIPECTTYSVGSSDGSNFSGKKYPERKITVGYQIICHTNTEFRDAYNKLNEVLNATQATIIFADEPDKYFIGTPSEAEEVDGGINCLTGEFSILCPDPFKYSVNDLIAVPGSDEYSTMSVEYAGTRKSYPEFDITFKSDCGYVVLMNDKQKIIQIGNPEETDGEDLPASQTLINHNFDSTSGWSMNAGTNSNPDVHTITGSVKIMEYGSYSVVAPNTYGEGNSWHGPTLSKEVPSDQSGEKGAVNWRTSFKLIMAISEGTSGNSEKGVFECLICDASKNIIAGFAIWKGDPGNKASARIYTAGLKYTDIPIDLSFHNKYFGWSTKDMIPSRTVSMSKKGSEFTVSFADIKRSFTSPEIADMKAEQMIFYFGRYQTVKYLYSNGVVWAKFIKDNCETYEDIPNKFSAGDEIRVDCKEGRIYLNDVETPEIGALGNDWEDFYLEPGLNQIGAAWSDFSQKPEITMKYKEVYI